MGRLWERGSPFPNSHLWVDPPSVGKFGHSYRVRNPGAVSVVFLPALAATKCISETKSHRLLEVYGPRPPIKIGGVKYWGCGVADCRVAGLRGSGTAGDG